MGDAREISQEAYRKVADALEPDGFLYRKSRAHLVKSDRGLTLLVRFQSSFRNVVSQQSGAGSLLGLMGGIPGIGGILDLMIFGKVAFITHLEVEDEHVGTWRKTLNDPVRTGALVASTNIGYLKSKHQWRELNLANPRLRNRRIAETIELIRQWGFPYFDLFRDPQRVIATLKQEPVPGMNDTGEVEYAACYAGPHAAREVLRRCIRQWPGCEDEYRAALRAFAENGIPKAWSPKAGERLARVSLGLGLEDQP